ncbi:DNA primase family protein [Paraburkholderia tropica]|uniref:DNA primase family protein n=1 Tax=Paraburkholderia tropica TaxID=92647 RepID=UPI002AB79F93|nr:phage/plasmid primase, P4 family [Paraburkholderia tropica]
MTQTSSAEQSVQPASDSRIGLKSVLQRCHAIGSINCPEAAAEPSLVHAAIRIAAPFKGGKAFVQTVLGPKLGWLPEDVDRNLAENGYLQPSPEGTYSPTCEQIRAQGFSGCPAGGCSGADGLPVNSPLALGGWEDCERKKIPQQVWARSVIAAKFPAGLRCVRGAVLYAYRGGIWERISEGELRHLVARHLDEVATPKLVGEVLSMMKLTSELVQAIVPSADHICFRNGTYNVLTRQLEPHSPIHNLLNRIDHEYVPGSLIDRWLGFLDETFAGDPDKAQKIALLQEWFGYCLTADARYQVMLLLIGLGANGKSVIVDLLRLLIGASNTADAMLHRLKVAHVRAELEGRLLNIASDLPKTGAADGYFKAVVAGDATEVSPKYESPYTIKPYVRIAACTNHLPPTHDDSEGYFRRLIIVGFNNIVPPGRRNPHLLQELQPEMPGIVAWAIEGLHRLRGRGRFELPDSSITLVQTYCEITSPLLTFAAECIEPSGDRSGYRVVDLFGAYSRWCKAHGHDAGNAISMGRDLKDLGFQSRKSGTTLWQVRPTSEGAQYFEPPRRPLPGTSAVSRQPVRTGSETGVLQSGGGGGEYGAS